VIGFVLEGEEEMNTIGFGWCKGCGKYFIKKVRYQRLCSSCLRKRNPPAWVRVYGRGEGKG